MVRELSCSQSNDDAENNTAIASMGSNETVLQRNCNSRNDAQTYTRHKKDGSLYTLMVQKQADKQEKKA